MNLQDLANTIRKGETSLVSVMAVNNEIGTLQPLKEIGELCRSNKVFFHTDAAQMLGKMPIDVDEMKIDLMSMSSHKIYGPKGIGGLYIRRRPRVRLTELISGGGQERGMRSGTLPHPLCVGFGEACEVAGREMMRDEKHVNRLSARLEKSIKERIPEVTVNGHAGGEDGMGYPGCLNVSFAYVEGESLLMALKNVAVSSGSACTSASLEPSYVLRALGVDDELAHSSLRYGERSECGERSEARKEMEDNITCLTANPSQLAPFVAGSGLEDSPQMRRLTLSSTCWRSTSPGSGT